MSSVAFACDLTNREDFLFGKKGKSAKVFMMTFSDHSMCSFHAPDQGFFAYFRVSLLIGENIWARENTEKRKSNKVKQLASQILYNNFETNVECKMI